MSYKVMNNSKMVILKNGTLLSLAPILPRLVNIVLLPIMTKYLTSVDYGIAGTISAYTQAIGAFSTLGLGIVLLNSFFKTNLEYKIIWSKIYGFLSVWMIVFAILQAIIIYFIVPQEAKPNTWWIILLTNFSTVFFGPTGAIGNAYFVYTKKAFPIVWRSVFASVLTIIIDFVLIVYLRLGYMGWYVGSFAGIFFVNASYWYVINKKLGIVPNYHYDWAFIKQSLKLSVPTIPHYYTQYLLEGSGRMVLSQFKVSQSEIGKVSISQQMGDIFQTGIKGVGDAVSPFIMESIKGETEKEVLKIGYLLVTSIFVLGFCLSLWSKEIFYVLLSNKELASSYPYFIVYIMALCYRPLYLIVSYYYFYYENTKQLLLITFVSGCIAVVLYYIFTPLLGVWAFLIGHYVSCLYYGYSGFVFPFYREKAKIRFPILLILVVQLLLTVVALVLVDKLLLKALATMFFAVLLVFCYFQYRYVIKK